MIPERRTHSVLFVLIMSVFTGITALIANNVDAQPPIDPRLDEPRGLRTKTELASPGFVLFNPGLSDTTYLINVDGEVVHTWVTDSAPGNAIYLLDNGHLLRQAKVPDVPFRGGGEGGGIQEFTWDGELIWDYRLAYDRYLLHHDIAVLPNGNVLAIAWDYKTPDEARSAGRRPDLLSEAGLRPDVILELERRGRNEAEIVWEWHAWDHWIQDFDPGAENYGVLSEHPERSDINSDGDELSEAELEVLLSGGAIALVDAEEDPYAPDIMHTNGIAYNSALDQIVLSIHDFHEIWVIDHSTTTEEAAGHTGGRFGMGGDLLYRWGNPSTYDRGDQQPQALFAQHHARWTESGFPGEGHITVFNNNFEGPEGVYSTVVEIDPPMNSENGYVIPTNGPFGPMEPVWTYSAPDKLSFRSHFISGAHRLSNGNTFINSGARGRFFEVTPQGEIVWEYWTPYSGDVGLPDDDSLPRGIAPYFYETFRATKIPPDHPALTDRDLTALDPQPPIVPPPVLE